MRRISIFLGLAAVLLILVVGYTYKLRLDALHGLRQRPTPQIKPMLEAIATRGWSYGKDDPRTNKPIVRITAKSFEAAHDPSSVGLHDVRLRLYDKAGAQYTFVHSESASFDDSSNVMRSHGAVQIVMNVPADKNADNPSDVANLVQVQTSGVSYNTQSGSADSDAPASFRFPAGDGSAVGVSYDPSARALVLKSNASLNWVGSGPAANKMHIEAGQLRYMEREHKVYLSPWSKMVRGGTTIEAKNSVVSLDSYGTLQRVDAMNASGVDLRDGKETHYKGDSVVAAFDDDGEVTRIDVVGHAAVLSEQPTSRTTLTGDRAQLRFDVKHTMVSGKDSGESSLHAVTADGHAVAESSPIAQPSSITQPGPALPETRILRSEHIELAMNPDGRTIREMRSPVQSRLEFRPNSVGQSHRTIEASSLRASYGDGSYIQSFEATNAVTHTQRVPVAKPGVAKPGAPLTTSEAVTSSDRLLASFEPASNRVHLIHQDGHFEYTEGKRHASADDATLDERVNSITLTGNARIGDETGSTSAGRIVMNQATGDMDASDHVVSVRVPDASQKPGGSMLDTTRVLQATADAMTSRENNTELVYSGHAEMWQGADRISAQRIEVNRDDQILTAKGDVVSELTDSGKTPTVNAAPLFTTVRAPELRYRDDERLADYTGGVVLTRGAMTVTSRELKAYLSPKPPPRPDGSPSDDSSLDHAFADGGVVVTTVSALGQRKGTGEHCEYYAKVGKVILNGGHPQLQDSRKGFTRGRQLTYFSDDDRLIVQGEKNQLAYTQMKK